MGPSYIGLLFVGAMLTLIASTAIADDANDEAINKVYNLAVGERFSVNYLYNAVKALQ